MSEKEEAAESTAVKHRKPRESYIIQQPQPPAAEAPATPVPREMTPEEKEFMKALTNLFTTAQEFGLTLASIDVEKDDLDPEIKELIEQGREVAKAVKRFQRLIKRRMPTE
jgi:DNA replication initiation complex subunit (GINS family)